MNYNNKDIIVDDLSDYFDIDKNFVLHGIDWESNNVLLETSRSVPRFWKWMYGHREGTIDEYRYFYAICPFYLFDLANFASQLNINKANAKKYIKGKCLDFGCGIGTVAIEMLNYPEVTQVDAVDVSIVSTDFLKFRISKHKLKINVIEPFDSVTNKRSSHKSLKEKYDFIYIRDVLEHAIDRIDIIKSLIQNVSDDGVICEASPIFDYPESVGKENIKLKDYDVWNVLVDNGFKIIEREWTGGFSDGYTNIWKKI
jgi:SAM-dependent methyltransferase